MKQFSKNDYYDVLNDINRVENATLSLQTLVNTKYGLQISLIIKTNWNRNDIPIKSEMKRLRSNILTLAQVIKPSYVIEPFESSFNYKNANDLEIALDYIYQQVKELIEIISQPIAGFYYANEPLLLMAERG